MKNVLIIAPHVDDELIGCWSVFNNPDNNISVVWLYELTDTRRKEGLRIGTSRSIKATIDNLEFGEEYVSRIIEVCDPVEVYVTSRKDSHLDHKKANAQFRSLATHFYSVDMVEAKYLGAYESHHKRIALDSIFPSQKALWDGNAKYYLFENITKCDYDSHTVLNYKGYRVTMPSDYSLNFYSDLVNANLKGPEELMDFILQKCPTGKVIVEHENLILSSEG